MPTALRAVLIQYRHGGADEAVEVDPERFAQWLKRHANLASLASNPAMMRVLQERLPQLAHRDISEALVNVEQLVEYIPDDALATLFQALYKEMSYNAAAQELNIVKYSA